MTTSRLTELLHDAADQVAAPQLAERAWVRAGQVRRRRIGIASGVGAALAVAGVLAAVAIPGRDVTTPPDVGNSPTGSSAVFVEPAVDRITGPLDVREIKPLPTRFTEPANPVRLSQRTMDRAVALYQPVNPDDDGVRPVYALSDRGTWHELDTMSITYTRDEGGNQAVPLRVTSLSPNGKYAAIPQPDALVIVDLTTGKVSSSDVPGFNEHVLWRGNDQLVVGGDKHRYTVERETRRVTKLPSTGPSIWDIVADPTGGGSWLELPATRFNGGEDPALRLREWRLDRGEPLGERAISQSALRLSGVNEWNARGWRSPGSGDLVVRAGFGRTQNVSGLGIVAVVDLRDNRVVRLVPLDGERNKGAAEALGWLDPRTALLRIEPEGLVAWDVTTGELRVVSAGPLRGTLSVQLP